MFIPSKCENDRGRANFVHYPSAHWSYITKRYNEIKEINKWFKDVEYSFQNVVLRGQTFIP